MRNNRMDLPKIYNNQDASLSIIRSKKVGIIGYGSQGKAHTKNLADSGVNVKVGLRSNSSSIKTVIDDGFTFCPIEDIVKNSDVICLLIPDSEIPSVYKSYVFDNLSKNKTMLFAHGYSVNYKQINIPNYVDVIMVAPSGGGEMVRNEYKEGRGIPNLLAIHQNYSDTAMDVALSYSKAIGGTRSGAFISTFKEETETDIFGEQVILTGGIIELIKQSYNVLVEDGYNPITAWFVCYYETKSIIDLFHTKGFEFLNNEISDLAEYGGLTRGKRIINKNVIKEMKIILDEIKSGHFKKEWDKETQSNFKTLKKMKSKVVDSDIEKLTKLMVNKYLK